MYVCMYVCVCVRICVWWVVLLIPCLLLSCVCVCVWVQTDFVASFGEKDTFRLHLSHMFSGGVSWDENGFYKEVDALEIYYEVCRAVDWKLRERYLLVRLRVR